MENGLAKKISEVAMGTFGGLISLGSIGVVAEIVNNFCTREYVPGSLEDSLSTPIYIAASLAFTNIAITSGYAAYDFFKAAFRDN